MRSMELVSSALRVLLEMSVVLDLIRELREPSRGSRCNRAEDLP